LIILKKDHSNSLKLLGFALDAAENNSKYSVLRFV